MTLLMLLCWSPALLHDLPVTLLGTLLQLVWAFLANALPSAFLPGSFLPHQLHLQQLWHKTVRPKIMCIALGAGGFTMSASSWLPPCQLSSLHFIE